MSRFGSRQRQHNECQSRINGKENGEQCCFDRHKNKNQEGASGRTFQGILQNQNRGHRRDSTPYGKERARAPATSPDARARFPRCPS